MTRASTPGLSSERWNLTAPVDALSDTSSCRGGLPEYSGATKIELLARSKTGVPVMPSGSMLPHGRSAAGDGVPRWVFHTCW